MRFGINGLGLLPGRGRGGVANYIFQLIRALPQARGDHTIFVYLRSDFAELDAIAGPGVMIRRIGVPSRPRGVQFATRVATEQAMLARHAARDGLDLLHFPDHVAAVFNRPPCPQVVTICDLTVFSHPETHALRTRAYMRRFIPPTLAACARVICISQHTADDVHTRFQTPRDRLDAVHLAAGEQHKPRTGAQIAPTLSRFGLAPQGYLLFLSTLEPRKNVDGLLRAYSQLGEGAPRLVIAGRRGRYYEGIFALVESLRLGERVVFTDYVSDEQAIDLYSGALAFVYPSHYEGFGLPVLEAMACGAPVVTTNVSSLPEIAGDAALLVPPGDDAALAAALARVAHDAPLRAALRTAGLRQAAQFSWERCARETVRVWEKAACGERGKR